MLGLRVERSVSRPALKGNIQHILWLGLQGGLKRAWAGGRITIKRKVGAHCDGNDYCVAAYLAADVS